MLAQRAFEKGLELVCLIDPEVPTLLQGDPGRLRQILLNLAANAIKFTKEGEVGIRVSLEKETDNNVKAHFAVSDTGIGIPQDRLDRLPFAIMIAVLGLMVAQPLGNAFQRHVTTSHDIRGLEILDVRRFVRGRTVFHRILTQS